MSISEATFETEDRSGRHGFGKSGIWIEKLSAVTLELKS